MRFLNLDPGFAPYGDSIRFKAFTFSGGEPHIKMLEDVKEETVMVTARVKSFNDMGMILVSVDALRRLGAGSIQLTLPYFPGARQDRFMVKGEPLTVKVYADLINSLKLDKVIVYDPHSDVAPALLDSVQVMSNHTFVAEVLKDFDDVCLVAPDAGAVKKIYETSRFLGGLEVVECRKSRDVRTGELSGFQVYSDDLEGKTCIVVDDICDGGGTFIGLAKELRRKNAGKLVLVVSHGIFSHGFEELLNWYASIYSTDSYLDASHEKVNRIELSQLLKKY